MMGDYFQTGEICAALVFHGVRAGKHGHVVVRRSSECVISVRGWIAYLYTSPGI